MAKGDHRAVLARSRGEKLLNPGERAQKHEELRSSLYNHTFSVKSSVDNIHCLTEEDIDIMRAKAFPSKYSQIKQYFGGIINKLLKNNEG